MSKQIEEVEPQCKEEILQVAELQSDDFHLDRPLYFACKADRKSLCAPVKSGEGRVFECLLKNKEEPTMSEECRVQLQANLFQKHLFLDQLTYNMTNDCSLIYQFSR